MIADHPAWDDLAPGPSPPVGSVGHVPEHTDVVVVGLGASGLAACGRLATRGADVVGLDAVGVAAGAAGANGGFLLAGLAMFHHDAVARLGRTRAVVAYRWTRERLHEVVAGEPTARRTGSLRLAVDEAEAEDIASQVAALRADGFPAEPWDGPAGRGVLVPDDAVVHPVARCRRLAWGAVDAGARLVAPAPVVRVRPDGVDLADGTTLGARAVVVAVDGGLEDLVPVDGVRSARLQMLATAAAPLARDRPEYRRWGFDYVQQVPTGEVLLGGGRDVGGDGEWGAPPRPTPVVQDHLDAELARLGVTASVTHRWAARGAFTADLLPVATTRDRSLHVIGGYSGHGNLLGPGLGRLAADVALDGGVLDARVPWAG